MICWQIKEGGSGLCLVCEEIYSPTRESWSYFLLISETHPAYEFKTLLPPLVHELLLAFIHPAGVCCVGGIHMGLLLKWVTYFMVSLPPHGNIERLPLNTWRASVLHVIFPSLCVSAFPVCLCCGTLFSPPFFYFLPGSYYSWRNSGHGTTKSSPTHYKEQSYSLSEATGL